MKGLSTFRAKLILTLFPIVAGVTIAALLLSEWKFSATYQRLFEEQFESQIAAVTSAKEKRLEALSTVLEKTAQTPAVLTAARRGNYNDALKELLPGLETLASDRLQNEFGLFNRNPQPPPAAPAPPRLWERKDDRKDDPGGKARPSPRHLAPGQIIPFISVVDNKGRFIANPRSRNGNPLANTADAPGPDTPTISRRSDKMPWLGGLKFEEVLKRQEVAYLIVEAGEKRGEQVREIFVTPLVDPDDGRFLGAFLFGLPMPLVADRLLYEQTKRSDHGEIMSGVFLEGKLISSTVPEDQKDIVARAITASMERTGHEKREIILPIGGVRHRLIYRVLNPDSPFPRAAQVNFYSLAPLDHEVAELRKEGVALGLSALLLAFLLIMFVSRGLSGPVRNLVAAAHEVERGNYAVRVPVGAGRDEVGRLARAFNDMAAGLALQEKYRSVLNAVADRAVAERLMEDRQALGGETREVTMLFCDIRGFTALTEKMPPHEVIELLNEHMTALTQVAYDHGGIVDKFVGDLIMVLFGAPVSSGHDVPRAVHCARAMIQTRRAMNATARHPLEIGVGIATGAVVAGCMGSDQRLSYTVLGHRVNLAARLCGIAQPGEIIVDQETVRQLPPDLSATTLPPMKLKGFSEPVPVFNIPAT